MTPDELRALAKRVETDISGIGLDGEIIDAIEWQKNPDRYWLALNQPWSGHRWFDQPSLLVSIDDAVVLVPDGWTWSVSNNATGAAIVRKGDISFEATAATPARAVTAAALLAMAWEKAQ